MTDTPKPDTAEQLLNEMIASQTKKIKQLTATRDGLNKKIDKEKHVLKKLSAEMEKIDNEQ